MAATALALMACAHGGQGTAGSAASIDGGISPMAWRAAREAYLVPAQYAAFIRRALNEPTAPRMAYAQAMNVLCGMVNLALASRRDPTESLGQFADLAAACPEVEAEHGDLDDLDRKLRAAPLPEDQQRIVQAIFTGRIGDRPASAFELLTDLQRLQDPMMTAFALQRLAPPAMTALLGASPPAGAKGTDAIHAWILAGCEATGTSRLMPGIVMLCVGRLGSCDRDLRARLRESKVERFAAIERLAARAAAALRTGDFEAYR